MGTGNGNGEWQRGMGTRNGYRNKKVRLRNGNGKLEQGIGTGNF